MTGEESASGALDLATLNVLARRANAHPLGAGWVYRPDPISPRRLEVSLDASQYPHEVEEVRLDIRWFEGGDHTFHYIETHGETVWQCRWDRHPKPEAPRAHFHPPPTASAEVEASRLDEEHHVGVLFAVLAWIESRIETIYDNR